jgi:hypothetical protein
MSLAAAALVGTSIASGPAPHYVEPKKPQPEPKVDSTYERAWRKSSLQARKPDYTPGNVGSLPKKAQRKHKRKKR